MLSDVLATSRQLGRSSSISVCGVEVSFRSADVVDPVVAEHSVDDEIP